jgi:hypothetical protein
MADDDRPRLSWKEIDQRRDGAGPRGARGEQKPRGRAAEARAEEATKQYLKEVDKIFTAAPGGAEGEVLAKAVQDAHGSPQLVEACLAYRDSLGMPTDSSLLTVFLDADDSQLVVATLDHMLELQKAGSLEATSGLKAQLRVLVQSFDDHIAGAAEDLQGVIG